MQYRQTLGLPIVTVGRKHLVANKVFKVIVRFVEPVAVVVIVGFIFVIFVAPLLLPSPAKPEVDQQKRRRPTAANDDDDDDGDGSAFTFPRFVVVDDSIAQNGPHAPTEMMVIANL